MDPRSFKNVFDGAKSGARFIVAFSDNKAGLESAKYLWMLHNESLISLDDPMQFEKIANQNTFPAENYRVQGFILLTALPKKEYISSNWNLTVFMQNLNTGIITATKGKNIKVTFVEKRNELTATFGAKGVDLAIYTEPEIVDFVAKPFWHEILKILIMLGHKKSGPNRLELSMELAQKLQLSFVD